MVKVNIDVTVDQRGLGCSENGRRPEMNFAIHNEII